VVWRARVGGWVGFEGVRFVRFVCLSRVLEVTQTHIHIHTHTFTPWRVPRGGGLCPGSPRCLFTGLKLCDESPRCRADLDARPRRDLLAQH